MDINKKYLLLIVLFVLLVSIPLTFAADNSTQIQTSNDNKNTITEQQEQTAINIQELSNTNNIQQSKNDNIIQDKQDNVNLRKNNKNTKKDGQKVTHITSFDRIIDENYDSVNLNIYVQDEENTRITQGIVSIKINDTLMDTFDLSSDKSYQTIQVSNLSFGNHTVYLSYNDELGEYLPCETTVTLSKVENWPVVIYVSPFYEPLLSTNESVTLEVGIQDGDDFGTIENGNVTLNLNVNDEYIPIKTVEVTGEYNPITMDMNTLLSYYDDTYPLNVSYRMDYNNSMGYYENNSLNGYFNVYKPSGNIVEIPYVEITAGENLTIPYTIKDENGNDINEGYSIESITREYSWDMPFTVNNDSVLITYNYYPVYNESLFWVITYENGESSVVKSMFTILPPKSTVFSTIYNREFYKNIKNMLINIHVYDEYGSYYDSFNTGIVKIYVDGNQVADVDLSTDSHEYYLSLKDISIGKHNITLTYNDESGEHPSNETSFTINKLDMLRPVCISGPRDVIVYKNQEEVYIDFDVYEEFEDDYGTYADLIYDGKVTINIDGNNVADINLEDYHYYELNLNDISVGNHTITLKYNDDFGEYTNVTTSFTLTKLDLTDVYLNVSNEYKMTSAEEFVEINYKTTDPYTNENITKGNVTFLINVDEDYVALKTVDVTDGIIKIYLNDILSNYESVDYPLEVNAILTYNDTTGQYQNQSSNIFINIYEASSNTVEIPDMEGSIPKKITIPVTVLNENGTEVNPEQYRITVNYDNNRFFNVEKDGSNVILDTNSVYAQTYTLYWTIYFNNGEVITKTSTLKLNPGMGPIGTWNVYQNTESISFDLEVYEYYEDAYYINYIPGQITIFIDNEINQSFNFNGYEYYYLDVSGLSIGEHNVLLVYNNDETNITCNTTITINKSGLTEPRISIIKYPDVVSTIDDETLEWEFRVTDDYEVVTRGNVTLYIQNESNTYVPIKTVDVTDNLTISINELTALYTDTDYPSYFNYYLKYNGDNEKYAESVSYGQCRLTNIKKSSISYERYEVTDEGTRFYIKVTDSQNNTITKGIIEFRLDVYDEDYNNKYDVHKEYSASDEYILIQDLNMDEELGSRVSLSYDFVDESGEYYNSDNYNNFQIRGSLTFDVDEHIYATEGSNAVFSFNLTDKNGNIVDRTYDGYINVFYIENNYWVETITDLENPEITFFRDYRPGNYQIVLEYSDYGPYNTLNNKTVILTVNPLEKISRFNQINDFTIYKDTNTYRIFYDLYDEHNYKIYEPVNIYVDDELIISTNQGYIDLAVYELSIGNHTLKIVYENENGEHPSNQTTANIYKEDKLSTTIYMFEIPEDISTDEENISFEYTLNSINGLVEEGTISLYIMEIDEDSELFENPEEIYIASDEASKGIITVKVDDIESKVSQNYPMNIYFILRYEGTQNYGNSSNSGNYFVLTDKKVSIIKYSGYNIEDGNTIISYTLKDKQAENITQGKVNLKITTWDSVVSEYNEYEISTDILNGQLTMNNLDLSKCPGFWINIILTYEDDSDIYEKSGESEGFTNTFSTEILAENTIGKINEYISIPINIIDQFDNQIDDGIIDVLGYNLEDDYFYELSDYIYDESTKTLNVKCDVANKYAIKIVFYPNDNSQYTSSSKIITVDAYDEDTIITRLELDDVTGITKTPVTITAKIYDTDNNPINEGYVIFTDSEGTQLGQANVVEGVATLEYAFNDEITTQITAKFIPESNNMLTSQNTSTINIQKPITAMSIDEVELTVGSNVTLTARLTDQFGNNINLGKVTFKVNGKTVKDANGKVVYAKVVDGVATVNYEVIASLAGKEVNITAVYSGSSNYNSEKTSILTNVTKEEAKLTITPFDEELMANTNIMLKAKVTDNNNPITKGKIVFKINGKTVKDDNGKVIYAKVDSNGEVSIDYNIGNLKEGTYTLTATFISSEYDKLQATTNMTVVKE